MAATPIAIVVFIAQGIWCLPLELGMSFGGGGGQSGNYQLSGDSRGSGLSSLMGRMLMANQGDLQLGTNLMNRATSVPASAVSHLASGLQLGTQGGNTDTASINVNAPGMFKAMGDMAGKALDVTDAGVQLGTGGAKMGAELVSDTSSTVKDIVKGLISGGDISSTFKPNSYTVSSSFNHNSGGSSEYGNGLDVSIPGKGMLSTVKDMAGLAVDMVDQDVQMKMKGAQVIPKVAGEATSTIKNIMKDMIGTSGIGGSISSKVPSTQSVYSKYEHNSGSNSNGGSTGKSGGSSTHEYSYDLNKPGTGIMNTVRDMTGSAVDMVDQGIQMKMKSEQVLPKMVGQASSTINKVMKDMIGSSGIGGSSNIPSTHSSMYEYKSGGNSNSDSIGNSGGSSKHKYFYGLNMPGTGIMSTVRDMAGSAVDMADQAVQLGTKGAQVVPERASQTSSAVKNIVKSMIGSVGVDSSSSPNEGTANSVSSTYNYHSGGNLHGGSTGKSGGSSTHEYSYDLNKPGTGIVNTVRDMAGSAINIVDQGVQMGTKGAQVIPEMVGHTSSTIKNVMKDVIGGSGMGDFSSFKVPVTHSSSTYEYKSDGNSNSDSTGNSGKASTHEYSYDLNVPRTGITSTVRDMAGSAVDMADQAVQLGTKGAQVIPKMASQASSAIQNTIKPMIGSAGGSSSGSSNEGRANSVSSTYNYQSGGNLHGGSTGKSGGSSTHENSYDFNKPGTGMMSTVRDMAGSAIDMVDQGVQMGTKGAQVIPKMAGQASSAIKNTIKTMIGSAGGGSSGSSNEGRANSVSSTYNHQSGGNLHGGSTGKSGGSSTHEYSYDSNMPGTGMMSTVRDMAGSAIDIVDQGVQIGTKGAQVIPKMASQASSAIKNTMKPMIGSAGGGNSGSSSEGSANSVSSTYSYQSSGNLQGGSTGNSRGSSYGDSSKHETSSGLNIPRTGMMSAVRDMAGSAIGMADKSVQMGANSAKVIPTVMRMMGSSKSGGDFSSSTSSHDVNDEVVESSS